MFGFLDTQWIDLPAGTDLSYIEGLRTRSGVDFAQVLREIDTRIGAFNEAVDPVVASLISVTDQLFQERVQATAFAVDETGEYTMPRPQFVEPLPNPMLPIRKYDVSTAWTEDGLMSMSLRSILNQVDSILLGMRVRARKEVIKRLFNDAEIRVDPKTTGTNPGFAGSGTGNNVFTGYYPDGSAVPGGYTHYIRDVAANRAADIKAYRDKIKKWYAGPYELLGTQTFLDAIAADSTNFVPVGSSLIRPAAGTAEALVDADTYLGVYDKDIRVLRSPITEFSGDYAVIYKTFGSMNSDNALAWRFDPLFGREAYLRSRALFPLDQAVVLWRFGVGVSNRTAAAIIQIAGSAGAYQAPTIA